MVSCSMTSHHSHNKVSHSSQDTASRTLLKQSHLNYLDSKITSTVNLMFEIVSHCPPSHHLVHCHNVSHITWYSQLRTLVTMYLTLSQMTTDWPCCYCLLLSFHNNTTVLSQSSGVLLSYWSAGLHAGLSLVPPSCPRVHCPLTSGL